MNGTAAWGFKQRAHDRLHEHTNKFQKAVANEQAQEGTANGHNQSHGDCNGIPQKWNQVFITKHPWHWPMTCRNETSRPTKLSTANTPCTQPRSQDFVAMPR